MAKPVFSTLDVHGTLAQWDETLTTVVSHVVRQRGRPEANGQLAADALDAESRRLQTLLHFGRIGAFFATSKDKPIGCHHSFGCLTGFGKKLRGTI